MLNVELKRNSKIVHNLSITIRWNWHSEWMEFFGNFNWFKRKSFRFRTFHRLIDFLFICIELNFLYIKLFLLMFTCNLWKKYSWQTSSSAVKCSWKLLFELHFAKSFSNWHIIARSFVWESITLSAAWKMICDALQTKSAIFRANECLNVIILRNSKCRNIFIFS